MRIFAKYNMLRSHDRYKPVSLENYSTEPTAAKMATTTMVAARAGVVREGCVY